MSDYFESRKKLVQGNEWRGTITVTIDYEEHEWTVRQLEDDEYFDVISNINRDELKKARDEVDQDKLEEFRDLRDSDDLSDEDEQRLEELREELEDNNIVDRIDEQTFNAIRRAGRYGVTPSDEDVDHVMGLTFQKQGELFGDLTDRIPEITDDEGNVRIQSREQARKAVKEDMRERLNSATRFISFEVGMKVLETTMSTEEDEGN